MYHIHSAMWAFKIDNCFLFPFQDSTELNWLRRKLNTRKAEIKKKKNTNTKFQLNKKKKTINKQTIWIWFPYIRLYFNFYFENILQEKIVHLPFELYISLWIICISLNFPFTMKLYDRYIYIYFSKIFNIYK